MMNNSRDRCLIVNADDFGQTEGVNRGIITAHEEGIVTSASLMVRWPAAAAAAAYAQSHPELSVGLHVDLGEWAYRNDTWVKIYDVAPPDDPAAVKEEVNAQLKQFLDLVGTGPSHIDSHQHVHRDEPVRSVVREIARQFQIPVRHFVPHVRYCGDFYGQTDTGEPFHQGICVENLLKILTSLPAGTTELACHPGNVDAHDLDTQYFWERQMEIDALCDHRVREVMGRAGITLCSFRQIQ